MLLIDRNVLMNEINDYTLAQSILVAQIIQLYKNVWAYYSQVFFPVQLL